MSFHAFMQIQELAFAITQPISFHAVTGACMQFQELPKDCLQFHHKLAGSYISLDAVGYENLYKQNPSC